MNDSYVKYINTGIRNLSNMFLILDVDLVQIGRAHV